MLPTIIVASVIGVAFVLVIASEIHKKKKGQGGCSSGGCSGCAMSSTCHSKK